MKRTLLLGALLTAGTLCLQDISVGHGGTYRGPGDTVPPGGGGGGGGGGPTTPGPSGPSAPGPSGPSTPGPSSPGAPAGNPAGGAAGPRTAASTGGIDFTVWQFWWGFNKDPYLNLKNKIHQGGPQSGSDDIFLGHGEAAQGKDTLKPSEESIRGQVVPALLKALANERSNDILTGSMIALAKIGDVLDESGKSQFVDVIRSFLDDSSLEVAETAAISLGILADKRSIDDLVSLMNDDAAGRKAVGSTQVNVRVRAFAAFGLGLIGYETKDNAERQIIAEHLIDVLNSPQFSRRDIKVAAMTALGLIPLDWESEAAAEAEESSNAKWVENRTTLLEFMLDYANPKEMRANKTTRHWFVNAHTPVAIARLMSAKIDDAPAELHAKYKALVKTHLMGLVGKHSKAEDQIQMSATIAMGILGDADMDQDDKDIRAELTRLVKEGDQQSRRFALIALGQVAGQPGTGDDPFGGTAEVRSYMLGQISRGKSGLRPWASMGLGVLGRARIDNSETADANASAALRLACAKEKAPSNVGAYCLALGLRKDLEATDTILEKMNGFKGNQDTRGDAAISLGLMDAVSAMQDIRAVIDKSKYKPELLKSCAVALGLLGDKEVVNTLLEMLKDSTGLATQAAISSALGQIGDARSIDPLIALLADDQQTDLARAFAAVALGIICDKELFPWNSKISNNINYRANTVTLTGDGGTGILDIL